MDTSTGGGYNGIQNVLFEMNIQLHTVTHYLHLLSKGRLLENLAGEKLIY
jgi:hypothetical protein